MNYSLILFVLISTISSIVPIKKELIRPGSFNQNRNILEFSNDYFPLNCNKILIYESDFGDAELKITQENNLNVFSLKSEDFTYRQKLLIDEKGIFVKETYQKINLMLGITKEGTMTYNEPLPRIKFPFEAGNKWNWKGKEFDDDAVYLLDVNSRIDRLEKIKVPAGTFEALKLVTEVKSTKGTKSFVTEWYAKDIGLIKMVAVVEGGGVLGAARDILGLGELVFELKQIKVRSK